MGSISVLGLWNFYLPVDIALHVSIPFMALWEKKIENHELSPVSVIL